MMKPDVVKDCQFPISESVSEYRSSKLEMLANLKTVKIIKVASHRLILMVFYDLTRNTVKIIKVSSLRLI